MADLDGHTLGGVITQTPALTGVEIKRAYADKGYIGHNLHIVLRWPRELLCELIAALAATIWPVSALRTAS
jgi:hypothetical protein